jgi:RHS repeat-associated protein
MDHVETRTSRTAAALLVLVFAVLLAPVGVVITQVIAQSMGGSNPPQLIVALDPISDAVSATPAEFRVDESGAATYSVPIFVVPGVAGVVPQLSLNYSSQGGFGPMGRGWSIGGLSSISRCRATREAGDFLGAATPDGNPRPINFTATDRFCLDGQRLVASPEVTCPAVGGMAVQELRTEIETFQRICAYQSSAEIGPAFFTVDRKDGSTSWYGDRDNHASANRTDGYVESTANGHTAKALSWAQTRFQDSTGNTIDFHYHENPTGGGAGEHLIAEVRYTGKVALPGQSAPAAPPFARVVFNYAGRAPEQWGSGYASGGLLRQSQQLASITSCGTLDCVVAQQVRHYVLNYQGSPSGNGLQTLASLHECRDQRAEVCAGATTFEWSTALHDFATGDTTSLSTGGVTLASNHFRGYKMGDINGDGRQDIAVLYLAGAGCNGGTWVISALGMQGILGQASFGNVTFNCVPANIVNRGEGAWHLFDYNGDGKDDLFVSSYTNTGWRVHPSNGTHFDMSTNLIAGLVPVIPSLDSENSQVQLADLNGDGLIDVLYPRPNGLMTRMMERQAGGFAFGPERGIGVLEETLPPIGIGIDCDTFNPDVRNCQRTITGVPTNKTGFVQMTDFNGDAASDVLIRITTSAEVWTNFPGCIREIEAFRASSPSNGLIEYYQDPAEVMQVSSPLNPCWETQSTDNLYALTVQNQTATSVHLAYYDIVSHGTPHAIVFADFNGDGLSDYAIRGTASSDWMYSINTGRHFWPQGTLGIANFRDQTRFVDVTGDGRSDVVQLVNYGGYKGYAVRPALPSGGFGLSQPLPGGNARLCNGSGCNEQLRAPAFGDFDGDGHLDFLSLDFSGAYLSVYTSRGSQPFVPRDTVVRITNGLGAKTELAYAPLTNTAVYRRADNSRNTHTWGRGAPVMDFLAPMYVVATASSSSPQPGAPNAMASVHYRYSHGRVQAGGRGFLGFSQIETIDPNQTGGFVVTSTSYVQNFPFIGMPSQTVKRVVGGSYTVPTCLSPWLVNNSCFAGPGGAHPDLGGQWFSISDHAWEVAPNSLSAQAPLHVRTLGTEEKVRDPYTGAQTSKVATAFSYGGHGNVSQTIVDTFTGSSTAPTATVITQNSYTDDVAKWRLGRLTSSTVTHQRPGQPSVVRTTGFSYAMSGPATGLLTEERLQPGGAAELASTKSYLLDDYGNRLQTTTCAGPATPCSTSGFQFRPAVPTHLKRYARVDYDERGRFPMSTWEPFWNSSGGAEHRTSYVAARDAFGQPAQVRDVNFNLSMSIRGWLGRDYFTWQQTSSSTSPINSGLRSITSYRKCEQVECPAGAAFRQQVEATASPRQWTYFDVLGRPIMQASETFNVGVSNEDVAATCTEYDAVGRPRRTSNPFFLTGTVGPGGPAGIGGVCATAARQWTTTTYDALGRAIHVQAPDGSQASVAYTGLTTTRIDPRGNPTHETRNGLGEVVAVTDAAGLTVHYTFDAAGNTVAVTRDAAGGVIANTFVYDVLGRKVQQSDPDTGLTSFEYNALGELTAQIDALGNRVEHAVDARGRVWRTSSKDYNGLTESESTFTFDTAQYGLGQLAQETIAGTYAAWSGQPGTALDYHRTHSFDALGRPTGSIVQVDGHLFFTNLMYDALGRPWQAADASGQAVKTEYGSRGHPQAICASNMMDPNPVCGGGDTFQRTLRTDAWGNVAHERRGNNAALDVVRNVWEMTGRVSSICAGTSGCSLVNEQYGWDAAGNLSSHVKEQRYLETFTYDGLNRLSTGTLLMRNGVTVHESTLAMGYDALGNICSRNGTGYGYGASAGCVSSSMAGAPMATAATITRTPLAQQVLTRSDIATARRPREGAAPWTVSSDARQMAFDPSPPPAIDTSGRAQIPTAWRERFVHGAQERSRLDSADAEWGLAHGFTGGTGTFLRRGRSTASGSGGSAAVPTSATVQAATSAFAMLTMSGPGGPHAVSQTNSGGNLTSYTYDHRGNQVHRDAPGTANDRSITYSLDDKAHEIQMGNGQRVRFWYGPDGQRYKREEAGKVTYYLGGMEAIVQGGVTTFKRYVGGIALQTVSNGIIQSTRYLFHDQLGSLVRIANSDGSIAESLDYMAFGGRRNPGDPHQTGTASPNTPRGYTGHEFVDGTGVIHMNGRIYDSELGRFLQADPVIQAPHNTQSWNAYTYVFNNPFAYTDPSGLISLRQALAVVFAAVYAYFTWDLTGASAVYAAIIGGAIAGAIATGTWRGAIMGAFTGAVTAGIGWAANTYEWGNLARTSAQAVSGGVMETLQGGNFGNGFFAAGLTAAVMPGLRGIRNDAIRTAAGALVGGTISKATGGKFANGAISGAIQAAMMGRKSTDVSDTENASNVNWSGPSKNFEDAPEDLRPMLQDPKQRKAALKEVARRLGYSRLNIQYVDSPQYLRLESGRYYGTDTVATVSRSFFGRYRITFYSTAFRAGEYGAIASIMDHEQFHVAIILGGRQIGRYDNELAAITYQRSRPSWSLTSDGFRAAIKRYEDMMIYCKSGGISEHC